MLSVWKLQHDSCVRLLNLKKEATMHNSNTLQWRLKSQGLPPLSIRVLWKRKIIPICCLFFKMTMDWNSNELGFCSVLSVKRMCWMNASVKIATTHSYMRKTTEMWNAKEEETENEVCSPVHCRKTKMCQALDTYYCTPQTPHCTDVV